MLPKRNKINKKLFNEVFKNGKTYHSNSLYAKISKLPTAQESKFAVVVPTKVSKKPTKRNKLKRQGYNIIKKHINEIKKGFVVIFFLKKGVPETDFVNYEKNIIDLLKKSKLFDF